MEKRRQATLTWSSSTRLRLFRREVRSLRHRVRDATYFKRSTNPTGEHRLSDLRALVVREFDEELKTAVLRRKDRHDVNYFFVVTNLSASKEAIARVDDVRRRLLRGRRRLHADIWWKERLTAFLDSSPDLWLVFPQIFPGGVAPLLAHAVKIGSEGLSRTFRLAISEQYKQDRIVKFRQIELEQRLFDLFVDVDVEVLADNGDLFGSPIGRVVSLR